MKNVFNHMMMALCIVDLFVIITNISVAAMALNPKSQVFLKIQPWSDAICHVAFSASVFLTISLTIERYSAIGNPLTYQTRVKKKGHWCIVFSYIIPSAILAILLNTLKIVQLSGLLSIINFS